jgi:hypothetical protein
MSSGRFRDWPASLRPARVGGASFYVDGDDIQTGRRLAVHEFPHRDEPYVEDLGRKANKISVTAYVLGDDAGEQEAALRAACERRGPLSLSLPMAQMLVHCETCRRTFHKDRLGLVSFDLEFVRHGSSAAPFGLPFAAGRLAALSSRLGEAAAVDLGGRIASATVRGRPSAAATEMLRTLAADLEAARVRTAIDPEIAPELAAAVSDLYRDAPDLARAGVRAGVGDRTTFASASETVATDIATRVIEIVGELLLASPADHVHETAVGLLEYGAGAAAPPYATRFREIEAANERAVGAIVRVAALVALMQATARAEPGSRAEAVDMRERLVSAYDATLDFMGEGWGGSETLRIVVDMMSATLDVVESAGLSLGEAVIAEAGTTMPSLWWAQRLYGSADNAEDLARRNRVVHPAFMPREIEAMLAAS